VTTPAPHRLYRARVSACYIRAPNDQRLPVKIGARDHRDFVTDGVASAIEQAKHVAGDKAVGLHGATVMQQALPLGLVDQIRVHVIPVLLGAGTALFGTLASPITLERTQALITPAATHIGFRVIR
jgi:dihydrofolate reductase